MTKILILSRIDDTAIAQLDAKYDVICAFDPTQDSLAERMRECEILIFRSGIQITAEVLRSAPNLALAVRAGSGTDNIDLVQAQSQGIRVITVPEPGATAVAELSFALMLGLARKIRVADNLLRQGRWAKQELTGHGFVSKTLGIVGADLVCSALCANPVPQFEAVLDMPPWHTCVTFSLDEFLGVIDALLPPLFLNTVFDHRRDQLRGMTAWQLNKSTANLAEIPQLTPAGCRRW